MKIILVILFVNWNHTVLEWDDHSGLLDCDRVFDRVVKHKQIENKNGRFTMATFFKGQEVLLYTCRYERIK